MEVFQLCRRILVVAKPCAKAAVLAVALVNEIKGKACGLLVKLIMSNLNNNEVCRTN